MFSKYKKVHLIEDGWMCDGFKKLATVDRFFKIQYVNVKIPGKLESIELSNTAVHANIFEFCITANKQDTAIFEDTIRKIKQSYPSLVKFEDSKHMLILQCSKNELLNVLPEVFNCFKSSQWQSIGFILEDMMGHLTEYECRDSLSPIKKS